MSPLVEYRDIPRFPGYKAGSDGSIWSNKSGTWKLKMAPLQGGSVAAKKNRKVIKYPRVSLGKRGRVTVSMHVHRLILAAFRGWKRNAQCRHLDGNPLNNNLDNLRWGTSKENHSDRIRHGTPNPQKNRGDKNGRAKISQEQAILVLEHAKAGKSVSEICSQLPIKKSSARDILSGRRWKHLPR